MNVINKKIKKKNTSLMDFNECEFELYQTLFIFLFWSYAFVIDGERGVCSLCMQYRFEDDTQCD